MKKIYLLFFLCVSAFAEDWTGFISDAKCSAKGGGEEHKQCAEGCVKAGSPPVLVADGKVYKIANPEKVMDHIGDKVVVKGSLAGEILTVNSVAAAE